MNSDIIGSFLEKYKIKYSLFLIVQSFFLLSTSIKDGGEIILFSVIAIQIFFLLNYFYNSFLSDFCLGISVLCGGLLMLLTVLVLIRDLLFIGEFNNINSAYSYIIRKDLSIERVADKETFQNMYGFKLLSEEKKLYFSSINKEQDEIISVLNQLTTKEEIESFKHKYNQKYFLLSEIADLDIYENNEWLIMHIQNNANKDLQELKRTDSNRYVFFGLKDKTKIFYKKIEGDIFIVPIKIN